MKKTFFYFFLTIFFIISCSKRDHVERTFDELVFIDHQNLRYVEDKYTTTIQVNQIKRNMDKAAEYGIDTYLIFAKQTFEAMLNYDFEIDGIGNIGGQAFTADSEHRQTGKYLRDALNEVLDYAKNKNLRVFFHSNQFVFPDEVLNVIKPAVWGTAVCPGREITWVVYRQKLNEFLTVFPGIAGFQVTGDETQVSVLECRCDSCRHLSFVDRVNLLTRETAKVCEQHDKEVQMRTWQRMGALEDEMDPSRMGEGMPENVLFSIKNTNGDFHLLNPTDEIFLHAADPERVVVEFDAWREYDGNNYFPCYMGDIWASRFRLLKELGIRRIAVRLNWNSNKNSIFERPFGNMVNIYIFQKLAENPQRSPDDILKEYIQNTFPEKARDVAFELYKFSPDFQHTIYYVNEDYCANHSRVQDEDAVRNLENAQKKGYLTKPEHFLERRLEIQNAHKKALSLIDHLGLDVSEEWRRGMTDGVNIGRYVGLATIYKIEAIFWKKQNNLEKMNTVKDLILQLQNEWKDIHPESYRSMNGEDANKHI